MSETWRVILEVEAASRDAVIAELHSLDTLGVEERGDEWLAYFAAERERGSIRAHFSAWPGVAWRGEGPVPVGDWERSWRDGLEPRHIGSLWVRPSWCASMGEPELVIDPKQAFGSGEHATTRLSLSLLLAALAPGDAVLDFGTGSGILALAALRQGAGRALGVEIDPVACVNANENAGANGLPLSLACGSLACVSQAAHFDVVVANLIRSRLQPWCERLASHASRDLILSGLLAAEVDAFLGFFEAQGWERVEQREEGQSGDRWVAVHLGRGRARQSSSRSRRVSDRS